MTSDSHGGRLPGQGAADRHAHRGRGRRLHRLARRGRQPPGRAAQRGRHPRARRPTASAAPSPPSPTPTWCWAASRGSRRLGGSITLDPGKARAAVAALAGRMTGARRGGAGRGHRQDRGGAHDLRDPRDLDPARPRSARLHPDRLRRRRADARRRAGGRDRHRARPRPAPSRELLGARPARLRHQARRRAHARGPARRAGAAARGAVRRDGSDGGAPARAGGLRSRARGACTARSTCAIAARPSS